jgi:hypothetical protein
MVHSTPGPLPAGRQENLESPPAGGQATVRRSPKNLNFKFKIINLKLKNSLTAEFYYII